MKHLIAVLLVLCLAPVARAEDWVDLELVLMVDVSRSMSPNELEIQRVGYVEALRSDEVLTAVQSGYHGRIAVTYVEWAGSQQVVVPWRILETREDLDAFADELSITFDLGYRRTSISEALIFGAALFDGNTVEGDRRVIDISGDGPNNLGRHVEAARDAVVAQGIVINGLPLMTQEGMGSEFQLERLDLYYESCVIGGVGAFVLPVLSWSDFPEAVRRKMVMEIHIGALDPMARIYRAQYVPPDSTDCLIGEKIWEARVRDWGSP